MQQVQHEACPDATLDISSALVLEVKVVPSEAGDSEQSIESVTAESGRSDHEPATIPEESEHTEDMHHEDVV